MLGLAKIAVGVKLEGTSEGIRECDKKYKYSNYSRGDNSGLFNWNEDFIL